eukprot:1142476-Pelagomonas_calceolata.AAC.4
MLPCTTAHWLSSCCTAVDSQGGYIQACPGAIPPLKEPHLFYRDAGVLLVVHHHTVSSWLYCRSCAAGSSGNLPLLPLLQSFRGMNEHVHIRPRSYRVRKSQDRVNTPAKEKNLIDMEQAVPPRLWVWTTTACLICNLLVNPPYSEAQDSRLPTSDISPWMDDGVAHTGHSLSRWSGPPPEGRVKFRTSMNSTLKPA